MSSAKPHASEGVGFLLGSIVRARRLWFRSLLSPYGLTPPQYAVLARLGERDGSCVGELAQRLFVDGPTLGRTLGRMERDRLVRRIQSPSDRRTFQVWLTERGGELLAELRPEIRRAERQLLSGLGDRSIHQLKSMLRTMLANAARDVGFEPPAELAASRRA